jgi:hypothetical protein
MFYLFDLFRFVGFLPAGHSFSPRGYWASISVKTMLLRYEADVKTVPSVTAFAAVPLHTTLVSSGCVQSP